MSQPDMGSIFHNMFQYVRRVYATAINFPCILNIDSSWTRYEQEDPRNIGTKTTNNENIQNTQILAISIVTKLILANIS